MSESARSEVDANPERARFIGKDVDVVIARTDRAELLPRLLPECIVLVLSSDLAQRLPGRRLEQWIVDRSVARFILAADAERDLTLDLARDVFEHRPIEGIDRQVRPNRRSEERRVGKE